MLDEKTDHIYNIILSIFIGVIIGLAFHIYHNEPTTVVLTHQSNNYASKVNYNNITSPAITRPATLRHCTNI